MNVKSDRRLDIQGLRAAAVLMVVLFHAGLPIPGGFVGVDVFFVISGFVITAMLHRQWLRNGRIRLGLFYWRRFKRLTPALALMISVTMIFSVLILSPLGSQQLTAQTAVGAMLIVANVVISRATGDYFAAPAAANPLLNTWSLSVEEQFYLVFPALLIFAWYLAARWGRLRSAPFVIISGIATASFTLAALGSLGFFPLFGGGDPVAEIGRFITGFYSPFTRAWEFAAGALLSLFLASRSVHVSALTRNMSGVMGIVLLIASGWIINFLTPFPGIWTLLPVAGTLFLLLAGSDKGSMVSLLLSAKAMTKIGDYSYSIYLWHWPFIVFAITLWPTAHYAPIIAGTLSLLPAVASYHWVEQPIRQKTNRSRKRALSFATMTLAIPIVLAGAVIATATYYLTPRLEPDTAQFANIEGFPNDTFYPSAAEGRLDKRERLPCYLDDCDSYNIAGLTFYQSKEGSGIQVAILGDSHATHLFDGFANRFDDTNIANFQIETIFRSESGVEIGVETARQIAKDDSIKTVVISAFWADPTSASVDPASLTRALSLLLESGKEVLIMDDVPDYPFEALGCRYKVALLATVNCSIDSNEFWAKHQTVMQPVLEAISSVQGVKLIETARYFCGSEDCSMVSNGELLYHDRSHLNLAGSKFLTENLDKDFSTLLDAATK